MRNLASRTQESTTSIHEIVSQLQQSAKAAVAVMEESQQEANHGKNLTVQVTSLFDDMLEALTTLDQHMVDVSTTINQQSTTAAEVTQLIVNIDNLATDSVEKSNYLSEKAQLTENQAKNLVSNLGSFNF